MGDRRRRGPIGGLIGLVGTGVGAAAEYREHRKEQKHQQQLSRENSQQDDAAVAGPSTAPTRGPSNTRSRDDLPPTYDRLLASGDRPMDDKKDALSQYDDDSSSDDDDDLSTEDDEEDWELDAVSDPKGLPSYEESEANYRTTEELVRAVMLTNRSGTSEKPKLRQPLPLPVILPQRRPRAKARGFVRAYAPVLEDSGIDQTTFMSFLDNFDKSSQASPVWTVIQVSSGIAGLAPSAIATAVTTAVQVASGTAKEFQSRQRTNGFLDQMNQELFMPNGLFAFIMKYKPESEIQQGGGLASRFGIKAQAVDSSTNQIVAKYGRATSEEQHCMSDRLKGIRLASGTTQGAVKLPEAAPLIFPAIDKTVAENGAEESFIDKAKDAKGFLADYLDRRAHQRYADTDPDSTLAVPEEQRALRSKLADPNHPMFQGGLVTLATGGAVSPRAAKRERSPGRQYKKDESRAREYEQRVDGGRRLSGKKQARYDNFVSEQDRLSLGGRSNHRDDGPGGHGGLLGGRRRRGGLISGLIRDDDSYGGSGGRRRRGGLVSGLIRAASSETSSGKSKEYEDTYYDHAPYDQTYEQDQRRRSYEAREARYGSTSAPQAYQGYKRGGRNGRRKGGAISAVRRIMREDVLYLMIVNMPSESELEEARQELGRLKSR